MATREEMRQAREREYRELADELALMLDRLKSEWTTLTVQQIRNIEHRALEIRGRLERLRQKGGRNAS